MAAVADEGDDAVLDHGVGEKAHAHVGDLGASGGLRIRIEAETEGLADPDAGHTLEPERGEGPLDGLPLGVGHTVARTDLDEHGEAHAIMLAQARREPATAGVPCAR